MQDTRYQSAFTLVELLVSLVVTSIILAAVATFAFVVSSANDATDDTGYKQAQVRFATFRITDIIHNCRLICARSDSGVALWRADGEPNDTNVGRINLNELVYIQKENGTDPNYLRLQLYQFPSSYTAQKSLADIAMLSLDDYGIAPVTLISDCNDIQFKLYDSNSVLITSPPWTGTKLVSITFDLTENGIIHKYQINSALSSWAGNLLNEDGTAIVSDDD